MICCHSFRHHNQHLTVHMQRFNLGYVVGVNTLFEQDNLSPSTPPPPLFIFSSIPFSDGDWKGEKVASSIASIKDT